MRKAGAVVMFLIAGFMLLGFSRSNADVSRGVTVFSLLLTVGLPIAVGIGLLRGPPRNSTRMNQLRRQTIDAEILRLATARTGRLTAVEITAALGLSDEDVQTALDAMVRREVADMDISEDGVLTYTFHDAKHLDGTRGKGLLNG